MIHPANNNIVYVERIGLKGMVSDVDILTKARNCGVGVCGCQIQAPWAGPREPRSACVLALQTYKIRTCNAATRIYLQRKFYLPTPEVLWITLAQCYVKQLCGVRGGVQDPRQMSAEQRHVFCPRG